MGSPDGRSHGKAREDNLKAVNEAVGRCKGRFENLVVLGIGGSALGTKALVNALRPPSWNEWDDECREFFPRLTVPEKVSTTTKSP